MCMDHGPFLLIHGQQEESLAEVNSLLMINGGVKLIDVFGKTRELSGNIVEVDLLNRRIVLG